MDGGGGDSRGQRSLWLMIKRGELRFRVQGQVVTFTAAATLTSKATVTDPLSRIDRSRFHINSSFNLFLSRNPHYQPLL